MSAPLLTLLRYAIATGCTYMASKGYTFFGFDSDTMNAVVQVVAYSIAAAMAGIGMWTSTVKRVFVRLQARHKTALVAEAAKVPDVQSITADAALADAIPSDKVVAS